MMSDSGSPPWSGYGKRRGSRKMDRTLQTEKLRLKLLMLEEEYRGKVMEQQIRAFYEKVYLSLQSLNIDQLVAMIQTIRHRTKPPRKITSLKELNKVVMQEAKRDAKQSKQRQNHSHEEDRCVKYFMWFFDYLDYLRELKINFTERIFHSLFRYFYEGEKQNDDRRGSLSTLSFSKTTSFSSDSGGSSGKSDGKEDMDDEDAISNARMKAHAKAALMVLSNEFEDIKTLYDTTEIDNVAQQLSHVKEQMDFLLDHEDSFDPGILGPSSLQLMQKYNLDEATEALVRLVPDVLFKLKTCGGLARKWIDLDSVRVKNLNLKLEKVTELEKKMNLTMTSLSEEIMRNEEELEKDLIELQNLLRREERSSDLGLQLDELVSKINTSHTKLENMRRERDKLTLGVQDSIRRKDREKYDELKVMYETNKLHRYVLDRQLRTLRFHRDIVEQDMKVELSIKPSLIHSTNSLQDQCEQLSEVITRDKSKKYTIKTALVPIIEDRNFISERIRQKRMSEPLPDFTQAQYVGSKRRPNPAGQAVFVKSHRQDPNVAQYLRTRVGTPDW